MCLVLRVLFLSLLTGTALLAVLGTVPALASTGGGGDMPWESPAGYARGQVGGRTLRNILIVAIIGAGIGFYFANEGTSIRSAFGLVIGFSIAAAAATWGPAFFGIASAATSTPALTTGAAITWGDWLSFGLRGLFWTAVFSRTVHWLCRMWGLAPGMASGTT